jgi:hypothetical protein
MKLINRPAISIAAVMFSLALTGSAFAAIDAKSDTAAAPKRDMSAYNSSVKAVKADYKVASSKCKGMTGAEHRNCMADAKAARKVGMSQAKEMRTTATTSESKMNAVGSVGKTPTAETTKKLSSP